MPSAANVVWLGFLASLVAGLGTGAGALGVFAVRRLSTKLEDALPGAAARRPDCSQGSR